MRNHLYAQAVTYQPSALMPGTASHASVCTTPLLLCVSQGTGSATRARTNGEADCPLATRTHRTSEQQRVHRCSESRCCSNGNGVTDQRQHSRRDDTHWRSAVLQGVRRAAAAHRDQLCVWAAFLVGWGVHKPAYLRGWACKHNGA